MNEVGSPAFCSYYGHSSRTNEEGGMSGLFSALHPITSRHVWSACAGFREEHLGRVGWKPLQTRGFTHSQTKRFEATGGV